MNHINDKTIIVNLAINVKFHRSFNKLLTPTRSTTTAVNLHICVATIAAHRYERGAKEIDQYSIRTLNRKNQKQCTLL